MDSEMNIQGNGNQIILHADQVQQKQESPLDHSLRMAELIDKVHTLFQERQALLSEKKEGYTMKVAETQLQMKRLLLEIDEMACYQKLSQAQNRLLAEISGEMLYEDYARKYWGRVFEDEFPFPELEAEYYRRYAQYLYENSPFRNWKPNTTGGMPSTCTTMDIGKRERPLSKRRCQSWPMTVTTNATSIPRPIRIGLRWSLSVKGATTC